MIKKISMRLCASLFVVSGFLFSAHASHELEHQLHVEHWMKTLEQHKLELIRVNAAFFLGELHDRIAVPTLIRSLNDPSTHVVRTSIHSLGLLGDASAIKPLYEVSVKHAGTELATEANRSINRIRAYLDFKRKQRS